MRKVRIFAYILLTILFSIPFFGNRCDFGQLYGAKPLHKISDSISLPKKQVEKKVRPIAPTKLSKPKHSTEKNAIHQSAAQLKDSTAVAVDSTAQDSVKKSKDPLDAIVNYNANDSIVLTAENIGHLYGKSTVKYGDINLNAERINIDMDSSLLSAKYGVDSIGKQFGYPVFTEKGTDYQSKTIKYNIKNKKGYITNIITQQGEGYVIADRAKKNTDGSIFMKDGKYTTCTDHNHPHFYLKLTKARVHPQKNAVSGPAYLVVEDLPIPFIGLPFGYFPFSKKYSSGIIMPSYGDELDRGFNLRDGGYYFAINDNIDLALTGEIYTKGSWGLNARSSYKKRYKYSGNFNFGYRVTKLGEKGIDQTISKDLAIDWTHTQDPKANMYRTLSASVNFSSSAYDRNDLNRQFTPDATQNTKSSTINLTQQIPNTPWSLSASMDVSQRTADSTVSLSLPSLTITMSRIYPFKKKEAVGTPKWYEKIALSYTGELHNSIETREDKLFKANLIKDWQNGMQHRIPISATFNLFNFINITPSFNYTERWYSNKIYEKWDPIANQSVVSDTTHSFYRVYDFNAALSFQTKLYGYFKPLFAKGVTIRHVFTPQVSFSYAPDFSDPRWGFYESYYYYDANGNLSKYTYSPFSRGTFGTAPQGKQGIINFQFDNNLEMKVPSAADSTGFKKLSLLDNLGIGFSYNMAATEFKWSDIVANLRLKLTKSLTVNLNTTFDPYLYKLDDNGQPIRVNELRISKGKFLGRLRSTGYSLSPSINQDTFAKLFHKDKDKDKSKKGKNKGNNLGTTQDSDNKTAPKSKSTGDYDADGYKNNSVKWSLSFNLSMDYSYNTQRWSQPDRRGYVEYKGQFTKNFGFSGNIQPTQNWSFNFNSSYDFDMKKIAYMTCNLTRNLHCWSITASFNPVGPYKNYYVSIRASSSLLQDLKYEQRGRQSSYDPNWD